MASSGFFSPTSEITMSASFSAAPVFSSTEPMNAPSMITMPMEVNVPEKPAPMTLARPEIFVPSSSTLSTSGMPAMMPRTSEMPMMDRNG